MIYDIGVYLRRRIGTATASLMENIRLHLSVNGYSLRQGLIEQCVRVHRSSSTDPWHRKLLFCGW